MPRSTFKSLQAWKTPHQLPVKSVQYIRKANTLELQRPRCVTDGTPGPTTNDDEVNTAQLREAIADGFSSRRARGRQRGQLQEEKTQVKYNVLCPQLKFIHLL
jgi:hypothetical protein